MLSWLLRSGRGAWLPVRPDAGCVGQPLWVLPVAAALESVVVQDWMIESIGDSVASGEGVPDLPTDRDCRAAG